MRKLLIVAIVACASRASAEEALPTVHNIPCEKICANSTGLVPLDRPLGQYPRFMLDNRVEGFVRFSAAVTKEGSVGELKTIAVVGPHQMVSYAEGIIRTWKWKPATLEGKAVAKTTGIQITYRMPREKPGARDQTLRAFREARGYIRDNKWAEAKAILDETQAKTQLNLYERGMIASVTAQIALKQGDYFEARRASVLATDHSADVLPPDVMLRLWETRTMASLALGDIVGGLDSFDKLKATKGFDPSAPVVKYVQDTQAKADAMPVFGMSARIPQPNDAEILELGVYRRTFAFRDIVGSLDSFILSCKQQAIQSKITDNAEWHIPKNFSECNLEVQGAPGTTFKVVQASD